MGIYIGYGVISVAAFAGWYLCRRRKKELPFVKYLPVFGAASLLCFILAVLDGDGSETVEKVMRPELGDQQIALLMDVEGMMDQEDYTVTVREQKLSERQKQQLMEAAVEELEQSIFQEQGESQIVSENLSLPDTLQGGRVQAAFTFWPGDVIDTEGVIHWEYFDAGEPLVQVSALLECQEAEIIHEFYLQLERPPLSESEAFYEELEEELKQQNERTDTEQFLLPSEVQGRRLAWYEMQEKSHWKPLLVGAVGILVHYLAGRSRKERKKKEWQEGLAMDYPDIVSRLSLLVGAGMTVSGAIGKLATEYHGNHAQGRWPMHPGYEELVRTWNEIQDGTGERKAYENLGTRCNQQQYRKLSSLLIQNVRKGAKGIQQLLDAEVTEVYLQQQAYVKQRGEEAAAKLLLPMGIMLILVFVILMVPAMLSLQLS